MRRAIGVVTVAVSDGGLFVVFLNNNTNRTTTTRTRTANNELVNTANLSLHCDLLAAIFLYTLQFPLTSSLIHSALSLSTIDRMSIRR